MKYLCLVYQDESKINALSEDEYALIMGEVLDFREELWQGGHYVASSPLQSVQSAMSVRVRNGKVLITDGPFAETKEQVGGFYLIEARDLNDAVRIASKMPLARLGGIEVRPLNENSPKDSSGLRREPSNAYGPDEATLRSRNDRC